MTSGVDMPTPVQVYVGSVYGVAWRHFHKWITQPANFMPTVLFPTVFLIAFAGGLSQLENIPNFDYPAGYTSFQYCFVILQTAVFGGMATGFSIAADFSTGFTRRLLVTVEHPSAIVLGYVASTMLRALIIGTFITLLSLLMGLNILGSVTDMLLLWTLALVMNASSTLWACGVMMRARNPQFAPAMQIPVFVSIFLAPVYMPLELLTGWIHDFAQANPFTYIMQGFRNLIGGLEGGREALVLSVGFIFVMMIIWGFTGLKRATRAG